MSDFAAFSTAFAELVRDGEIDAMVVPGTDLDAALACTWAVIEHYGIEQRFRSFDAFREERRAFFGGSRRWSGPTPAAVVWNLLVKKQRAALAKLLGAGGGATKKRPLDADGDPAENERRVRVKTEVRTALANLLNANMLPREIYVEIASNLALRPLLQRWGKVSVETTAIVNEVFPLLFKRDIIANLDLSAAGRKGMHWRLAWALKLVDGLPDGLPLTDLAERKLALAAYYKTAMDLVQHTMILWLCVRARDFWEDPDLRDNDLSMVSFSVRPGGAHLFWIDFFPYENEEGYLDMHITAARDPYLDRLVRRFEADCNAYRRQTGNSAKLASITRDMGEKKAALMAIFGAFLQDCLLGLSPALEMRMHNLFENGAFSQGGHVSLSTNARFIKTPTLDDLLASSSDESSSF